MTGSTHHPHTGATASHRPGGLYATRPPWDIGRPQPAFEALAEAGVLQGRVLDVAAAP